MASQRVGVPTAIDHKGRRFTHLDIDPTNPPYERPLKCPGCAVTVQPVAGYVTATEVEVPALFRLGKGLAHEDRCPWDFDRRAKGITAEAHGSVVVLDGRYTLLLESLPKGRGLQRAAGEFVRPTDTSRTRSQLSPQSQLIEIVRLLRTFVDDPHAVDQFQVRTPDGTLIPWRHFCFTAHADAKRLQSALATEPPHPRAVLAVIDQIAPCATGTSYAVHLKVRPATAAYQGPVRGAHGIPVKPVLRSRNEWDFAGLKPGDEIAAIGEWRNSGKLEQPTLWVTDPAQIVGIETS
jgi:hypothetical protein